MKKLLSIICTLAIVLGVVLVPGMVSASAATTATFSNFNVVSTTMTDAGNGVYYVTAGWKDHYIFTDFEMQAGKTYNITMNVGIDDYSGGVRLEAATADFKVKNRKGMPYSKGDKVMDNYILSYTFNADDMIDGDYKYIAFNINCAEGNPAKNGVKNIRICEVPSNEGYANVRATYEHGNWGVDDQGTWAFMGSKYYGWQNGQYDVVISPDKYYKIEFEYKGHSGRDGGHALGWSTTADGALSNGGSAIGANFVALPDQGVQVSNYKAYSQIVKGSDLGATETNKYLTICGQNILGAITYIRNVKVTEIEKPFFKSYYGVANMYTVTEGDVTYNEYGIPANDTFGAAWGSDHYMVSEYELEANSAYLVSYEWKGHNYGEPLWFAITNGTDYCNYRVVAPKTSNKGSYHKHGAIFYTGDKVTDTHKYFAMMVKDYGGDPYLVRNISIEKIDVANAGTLLPTAQNGNAFVRKENDKYALYANNWSDKGAFTFDYVINPEDTYKISFDFKGANRANDIEGGLANRFSLRTHTSTAATGFAAGVGAIIDTIPALDRRYGYHPYDFTFKGSDIGATADSKYLVLQYGYYYCDCFFKNIKIVNLSKTPADYTAVNAAIEDAGKYDASLYTNYDAVTAAINAVVEGKMADKQAEVDAMAQAINDAIAALQLKKADYSAVNAAVAEAQRLDGTLYTNYQAVEDAVNAVVPGLDITKQAEVDAMAQAINDAVAALQLKKADYTGVDNAIADAELLDKDLYKDFTAVDAAVNAVVKDKNITEQAAVDAMADAINNAIANLEFKDADYTAVEAAKAAANALVKENYVNFDAVDAAINAVDYTKNITEQAEVDAMAKAINDAVAALELKAADYTAVEEAIAAAEAIENKDIYSNWANVEAAINAVDYTKNITEQAEVDAMAKAINDAIKALAINPASYHADAIGTNGDSYGELTTSEDGRTVTLDANGTVRWANGGGTFGNWIGFKITAPVGLDATQIVILRSDGQTRILDNIKDGTTADGRVFAHMYLNVANLEGPSATYKVDWTNDGVYDLNIVLDFADIVRASDYSKVNAAIAEAESLNPALYTNYQAVQDAIDAVVYGLDGSKQAIIDGYAQAITDAIAALELKAADYTAVEEAIAAAEAINADLYDNYSVVDAAVKAVVYGLDITKQAEVDAYAQAINDAIAALELKVADYTAVEEAIAAANALNKANYVSFDAVDAAIAAVVYDLDITKQAEVDAYAQAINDAIAALELKAADYTAVEEAIAAADAVENKDIYSNWANVEAAINAVVYDLDITKQAQVDGYAQAILDAIAALDVKGADYSNVTAAIAAANALNKANYVSFDAVDAAIAAVVEGKKIEDQAEVDAWADAIYAAIDTLVYVDGFIEENGQLYYCENGAKALDKGVIVVDGKYYYIGFYGDVIGEGVHWINDKNLNGLTDPNGEALKAGLYTINADNTIKLLAGLVEEGGKLYYYENGQIATNKGLVLVGGKYYFIGAEGYALGEGVHWINDRNLNGLTDPNGVALKAGLYTVNADLTVKILAGLVAEGDKLYYYENGQIATNKGLVLVGGKYYFIGADGYALGEGVHWINNKNLNGLKTPGEQALKAGLYVVNADCTVKILEGIVEEGGKLYYYENGLKTAKGLVFEGGKYYFIGADCYALGEGVHWINEKNLNGLVASNGEALKPGLYTVNADCTVKILAGIVEEDGKLYYYENGVKVAKGLVYDETTDNYYCFGINYYAIGEGEYWFNDAKLNGQKDRNGEDLKAGLYTVNADCTVVIA